VVGERLDICAACGAPFVVPERLMGLHDNRLVVGLRCASCGVRKLAVVRAGMFEELLSRYDGGYDSHERTLDRGDIDRFAAALAADAILPEDF
jgi:DNA-directed RNA polymerase subunit RPC12/RpoP